MSHYAKPLHVMPATAGEALAAYRLVIVGTSDDAVIYPTAIRDTQIVGITLAAAAINEPVDVVTHGYALLKVDGNTANIAFGDAIMVHNSTGYGQKVASSGAGLVECIGFAMEASTADDDIISVRIAPHLEYFAS